mgnify:FL=1|tara:strand:+ start:14219 stop:14590 length:372 start_codon:yes stop_codon:yes gene_type:complete
MNEHIKIDIISKYIPERSNPAKSYYFFSYHVTIKNEGDLAAQLISRYWHITDGNGNTEDIHGPGVVGKQPHLSLGESFEYTSFCPLKTPVGTMEGSFQMLGEDGVHYDAIIKPFRLAIPEVLN